MHADAESVAVWVARQDGHVHVRISDDGRGGAQARPGSGLAGLVDRVAAAGGRLSVCTVGTTAGRGTLVEAPRDLRADHPDLGIVLLSQHIETRATLDLIASGGFGYLLKDRVFDVDEFLDALRRVAGGGSALDPEVVTELIGHQRRADPLTRLTTREREVLALMAEGRTNRGVARRLFLTERTVETHVAGIMTKLGLATGEEDHRRVLAVITYLGARG